MELNWDAPPDCDLNDDLLAYRKEFKAKEAAKPKLTKEEIERYGRQLILPEIAYEGQRLIKKGSVLIVGVGGLGCPAAMYLASAGVGTIGLVDYDSVELSNLHRQIIHSEKTVGMSKAESAKLFLQNLNSHVNIVTFQEQFTPKNALEIVRQFDIVLDCTDNVPTRYLLNDACCLEDKPLVSGSALGYEGQLTVYNAFGTPCYRCLFPEPPPPETVKNCSDGGVVGAVPGIIGTMQALETIKILVSRSGDRGKGTSFNGNLLLFDGWEGSFRKVSLRKPNRHCDSCSKTNKGRMTKLLDDYQAFCGTCSIDDKNQGINILKDEDRITPKEYQQLLESTSNEGVKKTSYVLIDVRKQNEVKLGTLPSASYQISYSDLEKWDREHLAESLHEYLTKRCKQYQEELKSTSSSATEDIKKLPVYVVCRRGNDSQRAVKFIRDKWPDLPIILKDIKGGLHQWAKDVDNNFPIY